MPISIVAGNWKMNTRVPEAFALATDIRDQLSNINEIEVVVCPPFISLNTVSEVLKYSSIQIGAQNTHNESYGAYTGEISPTMLKDFCKYVLIGHSERRKYFNETDLIINLKAKAAIDAGLIPIVCCGETLEERESELTSSVLSKQIYDSLQDLNPSSGLIVAYEPRWAIGSGVAANPRTAQSAMSHIRMDLENLWCQSIAYDIPILYGGSVTPTNVSVFMEEPDINGVLVGGASLLIDSFVQIVRKVAEPNN